MLYEAEKRINQQNYKNVDLILADDKTVWNKLNLKFDRITAAQVVQYLTPEQVDTFIYNASDYLNDGGKIILFDIIDPRLYPLWNTDGSQRTSNIGRLYLNSALNVSGEYRPF